MTIGELPQVSHPLLWHEREWAHLTAQIAEGRLPQALLLTGREHIGKSQLALALSRLLLCSRPDGMLNCGRCHACELSAQGNHGDFRWVEPMESSRVIKIEQVREMVRFTNTKAGLGSRKVIVLAPADRMNVNAFNALLKPLEEPAKDTYLILVCNQMQSVPPTIRSRCHLLRLATPDADACLKWLDKMTADPERSRSLLTIAGGLPMLAHQLYLSGNAEEHRGRHLALEALALGRMSIPEVAQLWSNDQISIFLDFLATDLQVRVGTLSEAHIKTDQTRVIFDLIDEVYRLHKAVISGANPNKQLLLLGLLSQYQRLLGTRPLGDNILTRTGDTGV